MISLLTKLFVFSRDHFTCVFCGRIAPGVELVVDRNLPKTRGGRDDLRNLYTACQDCSSDKGSRTVREYREFLKSREALLMQLGLRSKSASLGSGSQELEADDAPVEPHAKRSD